ncbi:hypothetical protein [Cesiribacter sp. SM1]|uniref:hypothetical protein n=1 Tax=Cesiribacter sp. SM1 TaxID=2861196 RepID=UPI001CD3B27E|nr:hypothetical protein [Cesiribacter sp. SM1]
MLSDKELEDIRRKMLELEEEPPAGAWSRIQPDIRPAWWIRLRWWLTGGLLLVGVFSGLMVYEPASLSRISNTLFEKQAATDVAKLPEVVLPEPAPDEADLHAAGPSSEVLNSPATATVQVAGSKENIGQVQENNIAAEGDLLPNTSVAPQQNANGARDIRTTAGANEAASGTNAVVARQPHLENRTQVQPALTAQPATGSDKADEKAANQYKGAAVNAAAADARNAVKAAMSSTVGDKTASSDKAAEAGTSTSPAMANNRQAEAGLVLQPAAATTDKQKPAEEQSVVAAEQHKTEAKNTEDAEKAAEVTEKAGAGSISSIDAAISTLKAGAPAGQREEVTAGDAGLPVQIVNTSVNQQQVPMSVAKEESLDGNKVDVAPAAELLPVIAPQGYLLDTATAYFIADSVLAVADSATQLGEATVVNKDKKQEGAWSVAVFFAPRYAYKTYKPNGEDEVLITSFNNGGGSAKDRMGYEFGFSVAKAVTPRLQLETSLGFMQLKENVSYTYTNGEVDTLLREVIADGQIALKPVLATADRQLVSNYAYGSWRVGANYYFWQNSLRRFNISVGGGLNLLIKGSTKVYSNGEWLETVEFPADDNPLEQLNYNVLLGIGYNLKVLGSYEVSATPMVNYYMGSTFKSREPFGLRPYTLGLNLQLRKTFLR